MESLVPKPSLLRRLFGWRLWRRVIFVLACLITLGVFLYVEETWRGKRAWDDFRRTSEANGERLDLADFVPPPVNDDENFCTTPLLAELFRYQGVLSPYGPHTEAELKKYEAEREIWVHGLRLYALRVTAKPTDVVPRASWGEAIPTEWKAWQEYYRGSKGFPSVPRQQPPAEDVLLALSKYDAEVKELRAANGRPFARFPMHYEEAPVMRTEQLSQLLGVTRVLSLRARAELELGRADEALTDIRICWRIHDALKRVPSLMPQLVRLGILPAPIQTLWEGLAGHHWADGQLQILQGQLETMDYLADYGFTMRSERAWGNSIWQMYRASGILKGPFAIRNQVASNRLYQEKVLPLVDAQKRRVYPDRVRAFMDWGTKDRTPYNVMAKMLAAALISQPQRFAHAQTVVNLALVACALERYWLVHGDYPETLDALAPQFIAKLPHDVIDGQPLRYHRTADGRFMLYSVGWNGTDDGGQVALNGRRPARMAEDYADWVWRYPPATKPSP